MSPADHLHNCLKTELELATQFIAILEQENQILLEPATNDQALADITQQKNLHAEKLIAAGNDRETALKALGVEPTREGLEQVVALNPELRPTFTDLMAAATQASELNASNGLIIDTFIAHNQQTLETLRNLVGEGTIYDAQGRTHTGGKGARRNIKAG